MSLYDDMMKMMEARPAVAPPPKKTASDLATLLAGGALPVQVRPDARPSPQMDVREMARKQLEAAGRFAPVPVDDHAPRVSAPAGMFRGIINKGAGRQAKPGTPKPSKKEGNALSLKLLKEMGIDDTPISGNSRVAQAFRVQGVSESPELNRVAGLPRRPADLNQYPDLTERLKKPGGTMTLWPVQNAALHEARIANGLLGALGTGHGKTILSLLVGEEMGARRIVLLVPPQLRVQLLQHDIPRLNKHWQLPLDRLNVVAYSELSSAKSAGILEELKPDLIVADEVHNVRHKTAARTKRFLRYMKEHPECRFVGLSGTITRRSIKDFGHLAELALRKNSPVPHNWHTLNEWAEAIDVSKDPMPPGALLRLCNEEELASIGAARNPLEVQEGVRSAFRRRMVETPGVVATEESAVGTSLVIRGLRPVVPAEVQIALQGLRDRWEIGSDELVDILSVVRVGCQLAGGFHYRYVWPGGEPDREWLDARSSWNKELREVLKHNRRGLDSPLQVVNAIHRGEYASTAYAAWAAVKDRYKPEPPREAVWVSDYLVKESIRWAKENGSRATPAIIWVSWRALADRIAAEGGLPLFGAGEEASQDLANVDVKKTPVIVCSQRAHGTGKNLQAFCRNLFTTPLGGTEMEQTLARSHRPGQLADEVTADIFVHTPEMERTFLSSLRDAQYAEQTQGQRQKLLYATRLNLPELEEE